MKNYLFPNRYKTISGWVFYISLVAGFYCWSMDFFDEFLVVPVPDLFGQTGGQNAILDELFTIIIIVSGLIHCFSKEKVEDELISKIRLDSLIWSLYVNYGLVILATIFIYEFLYFTALVYNLFTILLFFNFKLRYNLYKHYKS